MEDVKIKLAGLWFFFIVVMLVTMVLALFAPGIIDEIRAGEMRARLDDVRIVE